MRNSRNRKRNRRIIVVSLVIVLVTVLVVGLWMYSQYKEDQKTVEVLPVSQVSDSYWGDQAMSSGLISSDYIQELYASTDRAISEVFVTEGQEVHIGDPLIQYDKTQYELDVESKQIEVLKADLDLTTAQKQLTRLQNTKPAATPAPTKKPGPSSGTKPTPTPSAKPSSSPTPVPPADVPVYTVLNLDARPYKGTGTSEDPYIFLCTSDCAMTPEFLRCLLGVDPAPTPSPEDVENGFAGFTSPFAAVFEVREADSNHGALLSSFKLDGSQLSASFQSSSTLVNSYNTLDSVATIFGVTATTTPNNYNDMGYTSAQLKELINEKRQEIRTLQLARKQAELNLDLAKRQLENSTVLSTVDGTVRSLLDLETALSTSQPFMVVSGDSVYYVSGAISEALLGTVKIGDEVTVNDYMYGGSYTAEIVSISDYPLDRDSMLSYYGSGNPNSSSYEFTAVVKDGGEGLQSGNYVDITLNVQDEASMNALYIQNAYIREDEAGSYVMKAGLDNRLVKQYVKTGKSLYGYSLEIKSGLTMDDYIAFPYGSDVKEGVRVVIQGSEDSPQWGDDDLPVLDAPIDETTSDSGGVSEPGSSLPEDGEGSVPDDSALYDDTYQGSESGVILE